MDCAEGGLVWDDNIKRCEWESSTCSANEGNSENGSGNDSGNNSQDGVCVSSCKFMKDGDYQSCKRCDGFVKCANERLFEMDCAEGGLVWDDNIKRCEWESSTCSASEGNSDSGSGNSDSGSGNSDSGS